MKRVSLFLLFLLSHFTCAYSTTLLADNNEPLVNHAESPELEPQLPPTVSPEPFPENPGINNDHFYAEFFKMLFMLGLIIVMLLLASWFLKRLLNSRVQQVNSTSPIKIIERRALTAKTTVYVMDILGKKIAIAESQNGVTFLGDVSRASDRQVMEFMPPKQE